MSDVRIICFLAHSLIDLLFFFFFLPYGYEFTLVGIYKCNQGAVCDKVIKIIKGGQINIYKEGNLAFLGKSLNYPLVSIKERINNT